MTREQVNRTLRLMEQIRMDSYEARSKREERRLIKEYEMLWRSVEPFIAGSEPYTEDAQRTI